MKYIQSRWESAQVPDALVKWIIKLKELKFIRTGTCQSNVSLRQMMWLNKKVYKYV